MIFGIRTSHCTALLLLSTLAGAADAAQTVTYFGTALIRFESYGQGHPGALDGTYGFSATFSYGDNLEARAASLRVDGRLRSHFTYCPDPLLYCPDLAIGPTGIGSAAGTTPEDYITMGVTSPSGFGGQTLLGPGRKFYSLGPDDDSHAAISWALYDNATGFAYNFGNGVITRIEAGIPEPATWGLLVVGFALTGGALRRRPKPQALRRD